MTISLVVGSARKSTAAMRQRMRGLERTRGERRSGVGGVFEVALGEVVNPSMEGGDGDGVAGIGSPDFGVDGDEL